MSPLHQLACAAGLQIDWEDAAGKARHVDDEALRRVLEALGLATQNDRDIARSLEQQRTADRACTFVSADRGDPVILPPGCGAAGDAELEFEDGRVQRVTIEGDRDGLRLPPIDAVGYYRLHLADGVMRVAVAPPRCFGVADAAPGRKPWGVAVQVPALRDERALAFGDFGAVGAAARAFGRAGADALAISPVHALYPADARRFSPYAPSSREFLNIMFGDPGLIGHRVPPETGAADALIGWQGAIPARLAVLRAAFAERGPAVADAVVAYREEGGAALERHAIFDALHAHFFGRGAAGWQDWPRAYHDPAGDAVAHFAAEHRDQIDFFVFAQWLAKQSLNAAQRTATEAGMAIGLIADLAVGIDAGGSQAWSRPDDLLTGLSLGAPPDPLGPDGQNWGITGFSPAALRRTGFDAFIATLRAALDHAGGIRIDHALGLRRLWVVPDGASSAEGAYLTLPLDDMLRILAIESQRARAIVIGEDLGTVPVGLRPTLEARGMLGMRVLWFERDAEGGFTPPGSWQSQAVAMTGTHDLPTVAGWWRGRDLGWNRALGRGAQAADDEAARATDRNRLWGAFERSGAATGPQPAIDDTEPVVDAAVAQVGGAACAFAVLPMEDVLGLVEQPNLPGTTDEHPNWRRRMPGPTDELLAEPEVAARLRRLDALRTP